MTEKSALLILLLSFPMCANADDVARPPKGGVTPAELVVPADKTESLRDLWRKLNETDSVSTAEHRSSDLNAFVAWYNPYSGRAASHVYLYVLDKQKEVWECKLAKVYEDTLTISVEFGGGTMTIRGHERKVLQEYPEHAPGEQGGAGQPGTAPESKSQAKEKAEPESEGRCQ